MDISTLGQMFCKIFNREELVALARALGFLQRLRGIHPLDFALAVMGCAMGDETRSIASARRLFFGVTGYMPEESSFYDRFTAGAAEMMKRLFLEALARSTEAERRALVEALGGRGIVDLWAADATQVTLPRSAVWAFPSTNEAHGGIKVTATLSVLFQKIQRIEITDALTSDRRALGLPRWLHGVLIVLDLGYFDHKLFADIERRGGFFVSRLKENSFPVIETIRSGLGQCHLGETLDGYLPYRGVVDVDARFTVRGGKTRVFRVLRVPVLVETRDGGVIRDDLWFVTNLPAEQFSAETIATLYRYRWEIEQLFRTLKTVGRLDQLRSANAEVIHTFIYATLLGMALAQDVCAQMRRARPHVEPSLYRVFALLLRSLPDIVDAMETQRFHEELAALERALWREGVNPNPGRHYKSSIYANELRNAA
jgi:putative transposase